MTNKWLWKRVSVFPKLHGSLSAGRWNRHARPLNLGLGCLARREQETDHPVSWFGLQETDVFYFPPPGHLVGWLVARTILWGSSSRRGGDVRTEGPQYPAPTCSSVMRPLGSTELSCVEWCRMEQSQASLLSPAQQKKINVWFKPQGFGVIESAAVDD